MRRLLDGKEILLDFKIMHAISFDFNSTYSNKPHGLRKNFKK